MNDNVVLPFCQFPTRRPLAYQWVIEYAKECRMQLEFLVLYQILAEVEALDDSGNWGYHGQCCLSIQSIADTWGMSPATVRSAIKCLELAGIITVEVRAGAANTITLTPHTSWVVTNFRELRTIAKGKQRIPSPSPDAHTVTDTLSPDTLVTDTPVTNTPATPSPNTDTPPDTLTPITLPIVDSNGNVIDTVTIGELSVNTPPATNGELCPAHISRIFNNFKNGKKKLRVSPDTPATNTPATNTPDTPSPDTNTPDTNTPPDTTNTTDTPATPVKLDRG